MPQVKVATPKPGGSIPEGMLNKVMGGLGIVLILALVLSVGFCGGGGGEQANNSVDEGEAAAVQGVRPGLAVDRQLQDVISRQQAARAAAQRADAQAAAQAEAKARLDADAAEALRLSAAAADPYAGISPELRAALFDSWGEFPDPDMIEIQRQADLEELARRITSLRASPVALSFRGRRQAVTTEGEKAGEQLPLQQQDLLNALSSAGALLPGGSQPSQAGELEIPPPSSIRLPDYETPPRLLTPVDPPGWERVYEGTFLEAVLVTQLGGEFPGPVLATVSVPVYSADRQRVLIPRGARLIGSAQAVGRRDQAALAVGFHRLVLLDGRHIPLRFIGLGQEGATGLRDQVDRHYLSTFLAAGAVGILSGFAAVRGVPYAGGADGAIASGGSGVASTGQQVVGRFLNRLPTVTIRAGHRIRVWLTTDLLLPLPPSRQ